MANFNSSNKQEPGSLSLKELCSEAQVTERTVRYYIQESLLPPPEGTGFSARYTSEHVLRLKIIKRLKEDYLPLAEIRRRLEGTKLAELERLVLPEEIDITSQKETSEAKRYLDNLLAPRHGAKAAISQKNGPAEYIGQLIPAPTPKFASQVGISERATGLNEENWVRVKIIPEVEIHYQAGDSKRTRQISALLEQALLIFKP